MSETTIPVTDQNPPDLAAENAALKAEIARLTAPPPAAPRPIQVTRPADATED